MVDNQGTKGAKMSNYINIFTTNVHYPCGEGSSCCGPVGQTSEDIIKLKNSISKEFLCEIRTIEISNEEQMAGQKRVARLIKQFGQCVLPIITLNDEVVSMGILNKDEICKQIFARL